MSATPAVPELEAIARLRGVRGVLVTSLADALPIVSHAHVDVDVDGLAAFATMLFRRARHAARAAATGSVRTIALDAEHGRLVATARGELLMIVLSERSANPGLLRLSLTRALEGLD